jgi:hypothetical protein
MFPVFGLLAGLLPFWTGNAVPLPLFPADALVLDVTEMGDDPTRKTDSSDAIVKAISKQSHRIRGSHGPDSEVQEYPIDFETGKSFTLEAYVKLDHDPGADAIGKSRNRRSLPQTLEPDLLVGVFGSNRESNLGDRALHHHFTACGTRSETQAQW